MERGTDWTRQGLNESKQDGSWLQAGGRLADLGAFDVSSRYCDQGQATG